MQSTETQIMGQGGGSSLPFILGYDGTNSEELEAELVSGGRLVFFEYCISFIFFTLRHPSPVYLLRPNQWSWPRGIPYTLISLFLGWWGLPWGIVYTPLTVLTNMAGGRDVTAELRERVKLWNQPEVKRDGKGLRP
jgi:hypothetical protein